LDIFAELQLPGSIYRVVGLWAGRKGHGALSSSIGHLGPPWCDGFH